MKSRTEKSGSETDTGKPRASGCLIINLGFEVHHR